MGCFSAPARKRNMWDKKEKDSPKLTTFTTKTRCSNGTNRKFTACTAGHTIQFFFSASQYVPRSFSPGSLPSISAMEDKKQKRLVEAKTVWSVRTRAPMVRFGEAGKLIRRARRENQVVAAGPKTAIHIISRREKYKGGQKQLWEEGNNHTATIQRHPPRASKIVFIHPHLLHRLLGHHIPRCEQHLYH